MSRSLTSNFRDQIKSSQLHPALFLRFEFDSGDLNLWSGIGNKNWMGNIYTGAGDLLSVGTLEETQDLRATSLTVGLSGISSTVISLALTSNYQGRPVTIWFGVLTNNGDIINSPYEIFKGRMDIISFTDNGQASDFTVKCESNAIDIRKANARRFTDEDQKVDFPNDKGLEFISRIQDIDIVWG